MQLILRQPFAGLPDGASFLVAASPDSLARQPWQWDVRLERSPLGSSLACVGAGIGDHHVCASVDPAVIDASIRTIEVDEWRRLERPEAELWVAVLETGTVRHGRFDLTPGDVLVCEGDDPRVIDLEPLGPPASMALVALRRRDGQSVRWVP